MCPGCWPTLDLDQRSLVGSEQSAKAKAAARREGLMKINTTRIKCENWWTGRTGFRVGPKKGPALLISLDNAILASADLQTTDLSYSAGDTVFEHGAPAQFVYVSAEAHYVALGHCPEVAAQSCSFFSEMALVTNAQARRRIVPSCPIAFRL
jgi:hypothetical protein